MMTPDPPDAAALIQRAEQQFKELETDCLKEWPNSDWKQTRTLLIRAFNLSKSLLALLTARETALPPDIEPIRERVRRQAETGFLYDSTEIAAADRADLLKWFETERTMHAAWEKRAYEAEAKVTALEADLAYQHQNRDQIWEEKKRLEAALATAQQSLTSERIQRGLIREQRDALRDQVAQLRRERG